MYKGLETDLRCFLVVFFGFTSKSFDYIKFFEGLCKRSVTVDERFIKESMDVDCELKNDGKTGDL